MDFWAEIQGHLPQYNKYNTLPSRSCSQNSHDRQTPPQYQLYSEDQRNKTTDSGYYWPPKDISNWSTQESAATTSAVHFPFNLDHPIQQCHGDQCQESQDWTTYQHQEREGWSYNPAHYKRKKNDNFRELEAWALRYSHSLPRRRRIEAVLRGTTQDNIERRDMHMTNMQESALWDRASRQQVINSYQTMAQKQNLEVKDKFSYQTKLHSQPPNYNAPPPYSVQYKNVSPPQKLAKQSYELPQTVNKTEKELNEKFPVKGLDILQNRQMVQRRLSSNAAKVIEGRKFQLNKKAGGLTIFCLVSRITDAEPESLQVSPTQSKAVSPNAGSVSQPLTLADEVDFKIPTSTMKHVRSPLSKLQAIPICKESLSKMADKNTQKSNEVSVIGKLAAKFPLWRRPSFTSSSDTDNVPTSSLKETLDCNLQDQENDSKSDVESQREGPKEGDATVTDITCVVVKMDLLKGPKKQQVQYLNSENQTKTEENVAGVATQRNQDILTKQQDRRQAEDFKTFIEQAQSKDAVEKTKSEHFFTPNSETLDEHAQRTCGLCESTMCQLQENLNFGAENVTKQIYKTNDLKDERSVQKELVLNVSSVGKSENLQPLRVCRDEMERSSDIFEVGKYEENMTKPDKDFETENLEQERIAEVIGGQCKEPVEMSDSTDISTLELIERGGDKGILQTLNENKNLQQHLENTASELLESDVEEDTAGLSENKNDALQTVLRVGQAEHLSENISDLQDQDVRKVCEGSSDLVVNVANGKPGELKRTVKTDHQLDASTNELEMHEITKSMEELDSGQVEDAPTLEQSENELNQCVKLTETADVDLYGWNLAVLKDNTHCSTENTQNGEGIEGATRDFEIQEKRVGTIHEINESEILKEQSGVMAQEDTWGASNENVKDFEESENKKQFVCRNKACANDIPEVEILSDAEQKAGREEEKMKVHLMQFLEGQNGEGFPVDINKTISSNLEIKKSEELNENTEFGQEKGEIYAKDAIISAENLEVDRFLQITHEEEVVKSSDRLDLQEKEEREEGITAATCSKVHSETLVKDDEQANETEMQKDMDLKEQILDEIGKIDAADCDFNDFDMEECEWEDDIVYNDIMNDGLSAKDPDNEICQSTKSEDNLQPRVHPSGKDIPDSSLVYQPDSNDSAVVVRSEQFLPPTSTVDNDRCEKACCEEERKYPKSLWDAVSRIRKHTAPDSENEEEEVVENWDRESLVSVGSVRENVVQQGEVDEDLNMQEETLSQGSNSSQESDGTIVDGEVEITQMTNVESVEICAGEGQNVSENENIESESD